MSNWVAECRDGYRDVAWSNRIFALGLGGILFVTLYPFRFSLHTTLMGSASPLSLGAGGKGNGLFNSFLNVLLFMPFGFGLAQKLRKKGTSKAGTLILTTAAGAIFSYCIEFLQIYIPTRDSGWEDVFTNGAGAAVGCLIFDLFGGLLVKPLTIFEFRLNRFITLHRAVWFIPLYFGAWFAASIPMQKESRLSNWISNAQLLVGNEIGGRLDKVCKGEISRLQFWDHALSADNVRNIASGELKVEDAISPTASYEFSSSAPLEDERRFLPESKCIPNTPEEPGAHSLLFKRNAWVASQSSIWELIQALQKANAFSVRLVFTPAEIEGSDRRIVSISKEGGATDLSIRQREDNLVFWFRNPISVRHDLLSWVLPGVFSLHKTRDILFSYDGSNLAFYLDGKRDPRRYELTPGTALAQLFRHIKAAELEGYTFIYYALVFIPGGSLLGITARRLIALDVKEVLTLGMVCISFAVLLELLLVSVSGRAFSFGNVLLSVLLMISGFLWINADRHGSQIPATASDQK